MNGDCVAELVELFVSGDNIYNKRTGLSGFITDASAFISYNGTIQGVDIHAHIYEWYSYEYCIIKSREEGVDLPDDVLNFFSKERGFKYRHGNDSIERKLDHASDMPKNCEIFAEIIKKLVALDKQCRTE